MYAAAGKTAAVDAIVLSYTVFRRHDFYVYSGVLVDHGTFRGLAVARDASAIKLHRGRVARSIAAKRLTHLPSQR